MASSEQRVAASSHSSDWGQGVFLQPGSQGVASTTENLPLQSLPTTPSQGHDRGREDNAGGAEAVSSRPESPSYVVNVENDFQTKITVDRVLRGIHIFMIAFSGTLGVGLYVSGGTILRLGGPWALIFSYLMLSALAWSVMQCIGEMLCLWPISGSISEYVGRFVDKELGMAVGITYWLSNAMGFAALVIAASGEIAFWTDNRTAKLILLLAAFPFILVVINIWGGVKFYGKAELVGGSLKFTFALVIIGALITMYSGVYRAPGSPKPVWRNRHFDDQAAKTFGEAFIMCLPIASFAFVGVEMTAVTALEARGDRIQKHIPVSPLMIPATYMPIVVGVLYFLVGLFIALTVDSSSPLLPGQGWMNTNITTSGPGISSSVIVQAAQATTLRSLPVMISVFIVITALTAANTSLYIASRTLFGLARDVEYPVWLSKFGVTTDKLVPRRALFASCIFIPVTWASLDKNASTSVNNIFDVLSNMSSVACIIVWACEVVAYGRLYNCLYKFRTPLNAGDEFRNLKPSLRRFFEGRQEPEEKYPWKSFGQPWTYRFAFIGCFFIVFIANSASLWKGFHIQSFLSSFLAPICFLSLFVSLKVYRFRLRPWREGTGLVFGEHYGVDLDDIAVVKRIFYELQEIKKQSIPPDDGTDTKESGHWYW